MSAPIPVRLADGQVILVPPVRLSWATERPRLIALMDEVRRLIDGDAAQPGMAEQIAMLTEFWREVCSAAGFTGAVDLDVGDTLALYAALRGVVLPDPTPAQPGG